MTKIENNPSKEDTDEPFSPEKLEEIMNEEMIRKNELEILKQKYIEKQADKIMKNNPVKYILKVFHKLHVGDSNVAILLLLSIGCQNIINSNGIHVSVIGKSTGGKTNCCKTMLHLIPEGYKQKTELSKKAIWYVKDWNPGTVVFSNDVELSKDMESVIKRAIDVFQSGDDTYTVASPKKETVVLPLPARLAWWLTSVEASGNKQVLNRFYTANIDESKEQDERVYNRQIASDDNPLPETNEVKICREIMRNIKQGCFEILLNEELMKHNIIWNEDKSVRRRFESFKELVKAFAVLRYKRRPQYEGKIVATVKDYENAADLYNEIRGLPQLDEDEIDVWRIIYELTKSGFTYELRPVSEEEKKEGHYYYTPLVIARELGKKNYATSGADWARKVIKRLENKLPPKVILRKEDTPPTGGRAYRYASLLPPDSKIKLVEIKKEPLPESYIRETTGK